MPTFTSFVLLVLFVAHSNTYGDHRCPHGYGHYYGWGRQLETGGYRPSCYRFSADQVSWLEAKKDCLAEYADLVSIETAGENHHLVSVIKTNHYLQKPKFVDYEWWGFWTSGTDLPKEGRWMWSGVKSDIQYTNWHQGEPNNMHYVPRFPENCMMLARRVGWKWNDFGCQDNLISYICEKDATGRRGGFERNPPEVVADLFP